MTFVNTHKSVIRRRVDCLPRSWLFGKAYSEHLNLCRQADDGLLDVERYQRTALASLLTHALTTVPFYRKNYDISVSGITDDNAIEVLQRFDYLDKATVMACPKNFVSERFALDSLLTKTSGGSTGQGIRIFYSRKELGIERAYVEYPWYRLGFRPWSFIVQSLAAARRPYKEGPFSFGPRRAYLSCDHTTSEWMDEVVRVLCRTAPEFLHGYPSAWLAVARGFKAANRRLPVKGVLLCSEQVSAEQVRFLETVFGPVCVGYGQTERAVIGYAITQQEDLHYKLMPTYSYTENLTTQSGLSEIVGTNLFVRAMPLIRYRTQDLGKLDGKGGLLSLDGRQLEVLVTKKGECVPGTNVTIDPFLWDHVESYQFVQTKPGELEIHVVPRGNFTEEIKEVLLANQIRRMGELFDLRVVCVDAVRRSVTGKQRLVVSTLSPA